MKIGQKDIEATHYGMPATHMEALQEVAKTSGPIGIRPVSKFALSYINEGNPTKTFNIKNKSSNSGPSAGLIAIDPRFARAPVLSDAESAFSRSQVLKIIIEKEETMKEKHERDLAHAYEGDTHQETEYELKAIDLKLSHVRIGELLSLDSTMTFEELSDSPYKYKIEWGSINFKREAFALENADDTLSIFDSNHKPVKVLGRMVPDGLEKGITADYDILVACPSYKEFEPGGIDKTPFPTQGLTDKVLLKNKLDVLESAKHPEKFNAVESSTGGNWSERTENIVAAINKAVAKIDPSRDHEVLQTTHHNHEFNNPFADDIRNSLPALFVLPKEINLSSLLPPSASLEEMAAAAKAIYVLIETPQELNSLRNIIRNEGYYWPSHAKYVDVIQPFRPEVMELIESVNETARVAMRESLSFGSTGSIFAELNIIGPDAPLAPELTEDMVVRLNLGTTRELPIIDAEAKLDDSDDEIEVIFEEFDATPARSYEAAEPAEERSTLSSIRPR